MKFRIFIALLVTALILVSMANPVFGAVAVITMIPGLLIELYQWLKRRKIEKLERLKSS